jgi:hypothetical protein
LKVHWDDTSVTSPVQKIITAEKGVAIDFDSVSRDSKTQSKELYTWGQGEAEDIRDGAQTTFLLASTILLISFLQSPTGLPGSILSMDR